MEIIHSAFTLKTENYGKETLFMFKKNLVICLNNLKPNHRHMKDLTALTGPSYDLLTFI